MIRTERRNDGVALLTLDRAPARNALSFAVLEELLHALRETEDARCVVLAAEGPAFCAGHDLREIRAEPGREAYDRLFEQCSRLMQAIVALPQPVIARVHGIATAAGCQLVATCDLAVAAADARFATPGVNIGLFCSTPMVALSRNLSPKHAMEMLLLGEMVGASDAWRMGLVNRLVPAGEALAEARRMAETIASKSAHTLKIGKRAFYEQVEMSLSQAYDHATGVMVENMLARDAEEGIGAFVEKRAPVWEGR